MTYDELRASAKEKLTARYNREIHERSYSKAYDTLKRIMKYRLLDKDDPLVQPYNFRMLKDKGVDVSDIGPFDYRNYTENLPENMQFNSFEPKEIMVISESHWAKRRELQYVGDIILPEKVLRYNIMVKLGINTALCAYKSACALATTVKPNEKLNTFRNGLWEAIKIGKSKICSIDLSNESSYKLTTLGYLVITAQGKQVEVTSILDYEGMIEQRIDIKKTHRMIDKLIRQEMFHQGTQKVEFKPIANVDMIAQRQKEKYIEEPTISYEEFMEQRNSSREASEDFENGVE